VLLAENATAEQAAGFAAGALLDAAWRFNALRDASKDKDAPPARVTLAGANSAKVEPPPGSAPGAALRGALYARRSGGRTGQSAEPGELRGNGCLRCARNTA
jgi:hypothetical protein